MAHHVKNKDLREEIIRCKEADELSPVALDMFMLMADKFSNKLNYIYPEDKQDCIQFDLLGCTTCISVYFLFEVGQSGDGYFYRNNLDIITYYLQFSRIYSR